MQSGCFGGARQGHGNGDGLGVRVLLLLLGHPLVPECPRHPWG
ncbi:hypothetical protein STVIR_4051 [Streptomyces viridochromogenes Tue57]|uniref:Uncharacterized protein n=1 Tax=Streptomyces viridochromogenes Tue57 TaxID=1160705 RepID=L8PEN9_STRVR|nr:hypothetical protein STVIR_4051 [Streptomyces viridochromogenes Tue57]